MEIPGVQDGKRKKGTCKWLGPCQPRCQHTAGGTAEPAQNAKAQRSTAWCRAAAAGPQQQAPLACHRNVARAVPRLQGIDHDEPAHMASGCLLQRSVKLAGPACCEAHAMRMHRCAAMAVRPTGLPLRPTPALHGLFRLPQRTSRGTTCSLVHASTPCPAAAGSTLQCHSR